MNIHLYTSIWLYIWSKDFKIVNCFIIIWNITFIQGGKFFTCSPDIAKNLDFFHKNARTFFYVPYNRNKIGDQYNKEYNFKVANDFIFISM